MKVLEKPGPNSCVLNRFGKFGPGELERRTGEFLFESLLQDLGKLSLANWSSDLVTFEEILY